MIATHYLHHRMASSQSSRYQDSGSSVTGTIRSPDFLQRYLDRTAMVTVDERDLDLVTDLVGVERAVQVAGAVDVHVVDLDDHIADAEPVGGLAQADHAGLVGRAAGNDREDHDAIDSVLHRHLVGQD